MPAEADLLPSDGYFSFHIFKVLAFKVGAIFHEVFDVIEVLVYLAEAVEPGFSTDWGLEVAQKIPSLCEFLGRCIQSALLPLLSYLWVESFFFAPAGYFFLQWHEVVDPVF